MGTDVSIYVAEVPTGCSMMYYMCETVSDVAVSTYDNSSKVHENGSDE